MYIPTAFVLLVASAARATSILAKRAPSSELVGRDVTQGWSLQSGSAPTDAHSCGNGAYCPISLHCNALVNNHQVAACCSSCKCYSSRSSSMHSHIIASDCRGDVENAPICADSSWNLWVGYDGNGFCCEAGLVGVYDITKSVAGTCVSSNNSGSLRTAVLTSTGTGAAATSAVVVRITSCSGCFTSRYGQNACSRDIEVSE
jgi:hypothetical protein